jgi:hypothetical protein
MYLVRYSQYPRPGESLARNFPMLGPGRYAAAARRRGAFPQPSLICLSPAFGH